MTIMFFNSREPPFERVPGLYAALLMSADAMDANDMTGVRGPKQSCFVDIEKVCHDSSVYPFFFGVVCVCVFCFCTCFCVLMCMFVGLPCFVMWAKNKKAR